MPKCLYNMAMSQEGGANKEGSAMFRNLLLVNGESLAWWYGNPSRSLISHWERMLEERDCTHYMDL